MADFGEIGAQIGIGVGKIINFYLFSLAVGLIIGILLSVKAKKKYKLAIYILSPFVGLATGILIYNLFPNIL